MPLKTKIEFISIDKTGRIVSVRDYTGAYSTENPTGYGVPNPTYSDVKSIIFTLSAYDSKTINSVRYVRTVDPLHPEYLIIPLIDSITSGQKVDITSLTLQTSTLEQGLVSFPDGVLDLNMYTLVNEITGVSGTKGDNFILGANLDDIYESVDNIVVNNTVYTIDHSIPTNGGVILYLLENLLEDTTSFYPAYRANTKAYNASASNCCVTEATGRVALCSKCDDSKEMSILFQVLMYKVAAKISFDSQDYTKAQKLLEAAQKVCQHLNCKC